MRSEFISDVKIAAYARAPNQRKRRLFAIGDTAFVKINEKEAPKLAGEVLDQARTVAEFDC